LCSGCIDLLPTTSPECRFSSDVLGEWLLAEVDELQKVTVTSGMVSMSRLGEFICKGKHWNVHYYKLMSYYSNGWYANTCLVEDLWKKIILSTLNAKGGMIEG